MAHHLGISFRVQGPGFRVYHFGFRFRIWDLGFKVERRPNTPRTPLLSTHPNISVNSRSRELFLYVHHCIHRNRPPPNFVGALHVPTILLFFLKSMGGPLEPSWTCPITLEMLSLRVLKPLQNFWCNCLSSHCDLQKIPSKAASNPQISCLVYVARWCPYCLGRTALEAG